MEKIMAILGMILIIGGAYLFSNNKSEINWKGVGYAFIGQIVLAFIMLKTPLYKVIECISNGVSWLLAQANEGIGFVFGGIVQEGGFVFFINSLLPIVFLSAIIGLLFHFNILQKFISVVGNTIAKIFNVDTTVAVNSVGNMVIGQSESLLLTATQLKAKTVKESVIFATIVGGMTSISASVIGLYSGYGALVEYIIISMPLTVLSTLALTQIIMPTKYEGNEIVVEDEKGANAIDTMMAYANTGFKSVIGITVALIVFLSLVGMVNNLLGLVFDGLTLNKILGVIFYPVSLLMGISPEDASNVATMLGTKLATNEAVAFALPEFTMLSERSKAIMTIVNCSFAGVGSIGIMLGGYSAVAPDKVKIVSKLGVKALLTATAVNLLTGTALSLLI